MADANTDRARDIARLRIDRSQRDGTKGGARRWSRIWILVGIAVLAVIGGWRVASSSFGAATVDLYRVSVPRTGQSGSAIVLQAAGYVIPHYRIEVASKVVGRVKWMGVEKGDEVTKGEAIVRLEDAEYRAQLMESTGNLQSLQARLAAMEAGSRPEEIERAEGDLAEAKSRLRDAELELGRVRRLHAEEVASDAERDRARNDYEALQGRVESLENTMELLRIGPRQEDIDAARADVKRAQGRVAYNQTLVDATVIRAPVTGTVLERNVEVGELVTTGFVGDRGAKGYVVAMADLDDIQVELDISQNDFARVYMDQFAVIATDAYRDRDYDGQVVEISPEANRQKATVQVKVQILEPDRLIRPEMNANVSFLARPEGEPAGGGGAPQPRVSIPITALVDGSSVFVVVGGVAEKRSVTVATSTGDTVEIDRGLSGGEDIVLSPPEDLEDGDRVEESA